MELTDYINKITNPKINKRVHHILQLAEVKTKHLHVRSALDLLFNGLSVDPKSNQQSNTNIMSITTVEAVSNHPYFINVNKRRRYFCHLLSAYIDGTKQNLARQKQLLRLLSPQQAKELKASNQHLLTLFKKYHCKYCISTITLTHTKVPGLPNAYFGKLHYRLVHASDVLAIIDAVNDFVDEITSTED